MNKRNSRKIVLGYLLNGFHRLILLPDLFLYTSVKAPLILCFLDIGNK